MGHNSACVLLQVTLLTSIPIPGRYCIWWGITIALAAFTGVYEPWVVAFLEHSER